MRKTIRPAEARNTAIPVVRYSGHLAGNELTRLLAPIFLVEIAATLARYRFDDLKPGDVSMLIGLLGKIGILPNERGKMNLSAATSPASP